MTLSPGTRLGPYEVIALIGVGGMGEVYRATDINLKRAVAIKVLPASVAADIERLVRFQREGRTELHERDRAGRAELLDLALSQGRKGVARESGRPVPRVGPS